MSGSWSLPPPTARQMRYHQDVAEKQLALILMRFDDGPAEVTRIVPRITNSQEDIMAKTTKRRTKAQRDATNAKHLATNARKLAEDIAATTADNLSTQAPTSPEAYEVAKLVLPFMLANLGFGYGEIGELLGVSSSVAADLAQSGAYIAERMGVLCDARALANRNAAMRENRAVDFARKAAGAMQERIVLALPAFIRIAETGKVGEKHGIAAVVDMVKRFAVEDVVTESVASATLRTMGCSDVSTAGNKYPPGLLQGSGSQGGIIGGVERPRATRADEHQPDPRCSNNDEARSPSRY